MRTRFVKSPDDVQRFQEVFATPSFHDIRSLSLSFLSDPDVLAEVIPPPLAPAEEPLVSVSVSEIRRSDCVGHFFGCSFNLACTFEGKPGLYCLTMPMSTDTAVIFGRELFAEPKKLAEISLDEQNNHIVGKVTRHGITYIELAGNFETPLGEVGRETTTHHYYFKYLPAANGRGLAADPELVRVTHRGILHRSRRGTGTLTFRDSMHDPVIDIPVLSVLDAYHNELETHTTAEVVGTVDQQAFLPYAYGKLDHLLVWADAPVPARA